MQNEAIPDEADGASADIDAEQPNKHAHAIKKILGLIVAAVLIFVAQRDLRRRPPELVRGRVGVWKVIAMMAPGAMAYLLFGRRKAVPLATFETLNSIGA